MKKNKLLVDKQTHDYLLRYHFKWYKDVKAYIFDNHIMKIVFNPKKKTLTYNFDDKCDMIYLIVKNQDFYNRRKNYLIKKGLVDNASRFIYRLKLNVMSLKRGDDESKQVSNDNL